MKKYIKILLVASLLIIIYFCFAFYLRDKYSDTYESALQLMEDGQYSQAQSLFEQLGNYRDSIAHIEMAQHLIDYGIAEQYFNDGCYKDAYEAFDRLGDFNDSNIRAIESKYLYAVQLYDSGNYEEASSLFSALGEYKDSKSYLAGTLLTSVETLRQEVYEKAISYIENKAYSQALTELYKLDDYKDTEQLIQQCEKVLSMEKRARTISAGIFLSLGVTADGKIVCAGYDDIFDFSEWTDIISVSNLGVVSIGLKSDGTVVSTGKIEGASIDVSNWTDIIAVSAGERYIVGLKSDGTVVGQGHDAGDGQLQVNDWTNIVDIATGWRHTVGLDEDGKVFITGYGSNQQLREIENKSSDWVNIVSIAAGGGGDDGKGHTVGLRADGTVVAVGDNSYNQCDVGSWTNVIAVAAGDWYTVGLCSDGTVLATRPDRSKGEKYQFASNVDSWDNIVAIAAGCGYTLGLKKDGTVVSTGYNDSGQREGLETWNIAVYKSWINP